VKARPAKWTVLRDPHLAKEATALGLDLRYFGKPRPQDYLRHRENILIVEMSMYSAVNAGPSRTIGAADITYVIDLSTKTVKFLGLSDA
jgi:hypothetical protein